MRPVNNCFGLGFPHHLGQPRHLQDDQSGYDEEQHPEKSA